VENVGAISDRPPTAERTGEEMNEINNPSVSRWLTTPFTGGSLICPLSHFVTALPEGEPRVLAGTARFFC